VPTSAPTPKNMATRSPDKRLHAPSPGLLRNTRQQCFLLYKPLFTLSTHVPLYHREHSTIWNGLNRLIKFLLVLAFLVLVVVLFMPELKRQRTQQAQRDELAAEKGRLEELLARQVREVELLRTDTMFLETIARNKLDLMKPGETIIRIDPAP